MKQKIKKIGIKLIDPIAIKLGYTRFKPNSELRFTKNTLLKTFFNNLKLLGFIPEHIVDIGANHGTWTREALLYFPDAYYTLLEPQEWLKPSLQDLLDSNPKIDFLAVGAGEETGSFLFTIVNRDDSCSFRYSKEEAEKKDLKQIEIPVITLNELVKSRPDLPFPDLVKIDAEGLDIEVLKGASYLFGKTEVFLVEAGVNCKMFENNIFKMISFMEHNGYTLFDITDLNRPFHPKVLWLVELVFVKKGGVIDSYKIEVTL
jgi:FkbM family methyltransferase